MNPFVAALYDELPFCKSGCGACITELWNRIRVYAAPMQLEVWQVIASLEPAELVTAPHWEQRLRHLLGVRAIRGSTRQQLDPYLNQIIEQWLKTSQTVPVDNEMLLFIDFLVWDICHKLNGVSPIDRTLYSRVVQYCTNLALKTANGMLNLDELDSLVESLQIIRNTDGIYYDGLETLLKLSWSGSSRTARILRTTSSS